MRATLIQAKLFYVSSMPSQPQAEAQDDLTAVNTSGSKGIWDILHRTSQGVRKMTGRTSQHVSKLAFAAGANPLGRCSEVCHCAYVSATALSPSHSNMIVMQHTHCICIAYAAFAQPSSTVSPCNDLTSYAIACFCGVVHAHNTLSLGRSCHRTSLLDNSVQLLDISTLKLVF